MYCMYSNLIIGRGKYVLFSSPLFIAHRQNILMLFILISLFSCQSYLDLQCVIILPGLQCKVSTSKVWQSSDPRPGSHLFLITVCGYSTRFTVCIVSMSKVWARLDSHLFLFKVCGYSTWFTVCIVSMSKVWACPDSHLFLFRVCDYSIRFTVCIL